MAKSNDLRVLKVSIFEKQNLNKIREIIGKSIYLYPRLHAVIPLLI